MPFFISGLIVLIYYNLDFVEIGLVEILCPLWLLENIEINCDSIAVIPSSLLIEYVLIGSIGPISIFLFISEG